MNINIYNTLFFMPAITGCLFILFGLILFYYPPKKINRLYGYRTPNSMKNQKVWDFAQIYSAKQLIIFGVIYAFSSLIGLIIDFSERIELTICMSTLLLFVVVLFIKVEKAIKAHSTD